MVERDRPAAGDLAHHAPDHARGAARAARRAGRRRRSRARSRRRAVVARRTTRASSSAAIASIQSHVVARELGLVGEHVDDAGVEPRLEQRQQLGAHAVARNADVLRSTRPRRSGSAARRATRAAPRAGSRAAAGRSRRCADACRRGRAARRRASGAAAPSRPDRRACGRARRRRRRACARARSKNSWRAARAASSIDRRSRARARGDVLAVGDERHARATPPTPSANRSSSSGRRRGADG